MNIEILPPCISLQTVPLKFWVKFMWMEKEGTFNNVTKWWNEKGLKIQRFRRKEMFFKGIGAGCMWLRLAVAVRTPDRNEKCTVKYCARVCVYVQYEFSVSIPPSDICLINFFLFSLQLSLSLLWVSLLSFLYRTNIFVHLKYILIVNITIYNKH